jgi:hypothetical protein
MSVKPATRRGMLLLAVCAIIFMSRTTPGYVDFTGPFITRGESGEWVNARTFGLRVEKPYVVRKIRHNRFGKVEDRTTSGVWVIVRVDAVAMREPSMINSLALITESGKRYQHTERIRLPSKVGLLGRVLQPEMPVPALLVFEVPEDQIAHLELAAAEREFALLDSEVRIPLSWGNRNPAASIKESVDFTS